MSTIMTIVKSFNKLLTYIVVLDKSFWIVFLLVRACMLHPKGIDIRVDVPLEV